jgi:hypothetical protein
MDPHVRTDTTTTDNGFTGAAALLRYGASQIGVVSWRAQSEAYASEVEKQADKLEEVVRSTAAMKGGAAAEPPTGAEAIAAMKSEPGTEEEAESKEHNDVAALYLERANRLRALAAHQSTENGQLLLEIAEEYEDLASKLVAQR